MPDYIWAGVNRKGKKKKGKKGKGAGGNPWIVHCKKYQKKHNCSWKEAMSGAKSSYKK